MKQTLDIQNDSALQSVNQVSQAVKALYQQLAQVKSALSDIAGALGGGSGSKGPQYFGGSTANSTASVGGSGINLAGAGLTGGSGLNFAALLGIQGVSSAVQSTNPSIVQAQNQSVASILATGNLAARSGMTISDVNGYKVPDSTNAGRMFTSVMGSPGNYQPGFQDADSPLYQSYRGAKSAYRQAQASVYQGAAGVSALHAILDDGSASPVDGMGLNTYNRLGALREQANAQRFATLGSLASVGTLGTANVLNQMTQATVSGQQNAMGVGGGIGALFGGIIGFGLGGYIGAAAGATAGSAIVNSAQAPFSARYQAAQTLGGYAAATNQSAMSLAKGADADARRINDAYLAKEDYSLGGDIRYALRNLGLYQGTDQTSTQQVAQTQAALGGGYLQNGVLLSSGALRAQANRLTENYGTNAPQVAETLAKAIGGLSASGNNMFDLARRVGITPAVTYLQDANRPHQAEQLTRTFGLYNAAEYGEAGANSVSRGLSADYEATGYSGRSTRSRTSEFNEAIGGLRSQVSAVDSSLSVLNAGGFGNSNEAKAKKALRQELLRDIARESSTRAASVLSDAEGAGGVLISQANVGLTRANLYGGAGDFAGAGKNLLAALNNEAGGISSALRDPNLSYSDRLRGEQRLNEIASQRIQVPAQVAGAAFRRNILGADVSVAKSGVGYNYAGAYGTDSQLGDAALGGINAQGSIISAAQAALRDPNLSVEDRAAAQQRIAGAQNSQLQLRIGSRDTLLGRIAGRASVSQGAAGLALTRASVLGTGSDLRAASAGAVGAYGDEQKQIATQLSAGGLTVDQEIRLKQRQNSLSGEIFSTQQSAIDAGYAKDDLTGFITPQRKLQGQLERLQYLPFSASNPVKLSIQAIGLNNKQLGVLNSREEELRKGGNLSPERQDAIEAARQSIETQNAAAVSTISEGFLDRLPALSAGRPSFGAKFTSFSAAAANLSLMSGNPIRSFGAVSGAQLRTQDDYIRAAGGTPEQIAPHSRMSSLDNAGRDDQLASAINRLTDWLSNSTGNAPQTSGVRRGEQLGGAQANLSSRDLGQRGAAGNRN